MALMIFLLPLGSSFIRNLPKQIITKAIGNTERRWRIHCVANEQAKNLSTNQHSGYYKPSSWTHEFVMSLMNDSGKKVPKDSSIRELEEAVKYMFDDEDAEPLDILQLIDEIQRLGLGYRFRESTKCALDRIIVSEKVMKKMDHCIHTCALYFTLLRQHGYKVSADIFENFKDHNGNFKGRLAQDVPGMLKLYEASHVAYTGENILDEAREFTTMNLKEMLGKTDMKMGARVRHALEIPFQRRMQRLEARWNIEACTNNDEADQLLLKLAKLDFNMVQSMLQRDLQQVSCWWKDVGLANKLYFARDRLMESFFWSVGMVFEPQFSECTKGLTKVAKLITIIDDVYDVYGSLEELEQFTDAIERWDINALQHLPGCMKICFLALYNTVNNMAYDVLKEQGQVIVPQLAKVWADLCKLFLKEAQWSYNKHIPTFDEYLSMGWLSSSGPLLLVHAYFLMDKNITNEAIECFNDYPALLRYPSTIFRLCNDLSSSKAEIERGETANAISCYMHENGVSEEVARRYIRNLIDDNWKMMNKELVSNSLFSNSFIEIAINLARISQCHYQHGNAHSDPNDITRNRVLSVIIEPIQLTAIEDLQTTYKLREKIVSFKK
ncbi:isoprene synthase, chloroplastic-like [Olea europaea subsp. europaea]|uniref:Isoprene synthase, chloroplastic-like n=1 Tax=Olea europaea subsp. europaea TaxID=158383 RepID=A0A8S0UCF3_OLEEU|nr:isoprene synthase, chloroplastic-like [Olea europaea subsp. europaea]